MHMVTGTNWIYRGEVIMLSKSNFFSLIFKYTCEPIWDVNNDRYSSQVLQSMLIKAVI